MGNREKIITLPTYCCVALSENCFFRCQMCYKWKLDMAIINPDAPNMNDWKRFVHSLKKMVGDRFQINFAGGESLMKEETLELIRCAANEGFNTLLATNGFLIDEKMARKIADSGVGIVNISLDSLKEDRHDYLRGVKGAYQNVMRALELLDAYAANVHVGICTVISGRNIDELGAIVNWVEANNKVDGMGFQAVTQPFSTPEDSLWYQSAEYNELWPKDIGEVDRAMDELIEMKKFGLTKLGNPINQLYVYKAYFRNPNNFIKKQKCHIDTQTINVTPEGEIRICFYMEAIGNIKDDDIGDVWFSQKAQKIREEIALCKKNCQSMVNCNFEPSEIYVY